MCQRSTCCFAGEGARLGCCLGSRRARRPFCLKSHATVASNALRLNRFALSRPFSDELMHGLEQLVEAVVEQLSEAATALLQRTRARFAQLW